MGLSENKKLIIDRLVNHLEKYPEIRFCQALYGLGIIENIEINKDNNKPSTLYSKDHYHDNDKVVINRMINFKDETLSEEWFK